MHFDLNSLIGLAIGVIALVIRHSIKTPRDSERAALLATLANDAAAVVLNLAPAGTPWAQLVRDVVARIIAESSLPTTNHAKVEQAATAALVRLGVRSVDAAKK